MESAKSLVPVDSFRNKYGSDSAGGTRAVVIIASLASLPSDDVVPRRSHTLSEEDKDVLTKGLTLPPNRWTDLDVVLARYAQNKSVAIGPQVIFTNENNLSCEAVLSRLRDFFKASTDKNGAIVHYFGNGKRNTGDWCFSDGFITFQDLMDVYMETYRGRVLTIVSDCSHSGTWVKQCYEFMDGQGIPPCGHHAVDKGVLIKVLTSCKGNQIAEVLEFSLKCMYLDKNVNHTKFRIPKTLSDTQKSSGRDFTEMLCGKNIDEKCDLDVSKTWQLKSLVGRLRIVRGTDRGKPVWHYLLLVDDEDTIDAFEKALGGSLNAANYGEILFSGFGKDPPNEITEKVHKKYKIK